MLLKRKLCVAVAVAAVVLLMLASQSIQTKHFLPLSLATPTADNISQEMAPPADGSSAHALVSLEEQPEKGDTRPCGCSEYCVSDPSASDWFRGRYDPDQRPVLRGADDRLDPDALNWWLSLQRSGNDQSVQEVMSRMFQVISPPSVDFAPRPSRCRTCAVVGNSGNLQKSGHGKFIDAHAAVIRMNKAVTRGFEKDVGNRTTHHFLYPESAVDVARGVSLILLPFKIRDLEWLTSALSTGDVKMTYMRVKERVEADKDKVAVVNPAFFKCRCSVTAPTGRATGTTTGRRTATRAPSARRACTAPTSRRKSSGGWRTSVRSDCTREPGGPAGRPLALNKRKPRRPFCAFSATVWKNVLV
ncbi:ST3 beta-galactoside alpha-2,3-sialyltransferase 8 isoform X1 [Phycodurus eques]|uniref:ST3 beta-galactoside alpha-2,3-sialyltransferase 8 isoform X1 n=1 Tax=Phycodurus eques TaxID=693459 RepID=UPI002ACDF9FD|nr:ST3 beta-galactoside alpha-2,3-sialyltransferase 8 isoform X1 [Phycodurus eques]XP_061544612.1 ST3 beta-galactoside alpha-2,3-sialyltransferase 8 isoform X1 [Phycodurus eques]XP_061544613.1 ST3 beta-galactoside alpha-2,3-sialyltransferase 8 isoform X1 [Phycodurus eques]